jgi:hypothetical protein
VLRINASSYGVEMSEVFMERDIGRWRERKKLYIKMDIYGNRLSSW